MNEYALHASLLVNIGCLPRTRINKQIDTKGGLHVRLACPKCTAFLWASTMRSGWRSWTSIFGTVNNRSVACLELILLHQLRHRVNRCTLRLHLFLLRQLHRRSLMEKRAAIFEDKADDELTSKDKVVYKYREERSKQLIFSSRTINFSEEYFNEQYDKEQSASVKESIAELNKKETQKQQQFGDGPNRARPSLGSHK